MALNRIISAFLLVLLAHPGLTQVNRYMVFLSDKEGTPFNLDEPEGFLSTRAIERRQHHSFQPNEDDLPVNPDYLQQVANTGVEVYYQSRWLNAVLVQADVSQLPLIEALEIVSEVEYVGPGAKLSGRLGANLPDFDPEPNEVASTLQNQMIDITEMHAQGFAGEGILIALFDGGFKGVDEAGPFQHLYDNNQIKGVFNYVNNDLDVYQFTDHGTQVFSVMAAYDTGEIIGTAFQSDYFLMVTEEDGPEFTIEEYNWLFAAEFADSAGVDLINASLGYFHFDDSNMDYTFDDFDGQTTVVARAANFAAERGILIVVSAGNEGNLSWEHITSPADSENVLGVGAVNTQNTVADFSSVGPTIDGRFKPDLVALGVGTTTIRASGTISLSSGTSFAAPLVAGLAAGFWQAYPNLTNLEVIEKLRRSGDTYDTPDNQRGFGLPSFVEAQEIVGIHDELPSSSIHIYPNPTSTVLTISIGEELQAIQINAAIYDTNGQLILDNGSRGRRSIEMDLRQFAAGVYILSITSLKENRRIKIIKY